MQRTSKFNAKRLYLIPKFKGFLSSRTTTGFAGRYSIIFYFLWISYCRKILNYTIEYLFLCGYIWERIYKLCIRKTCLRNPMGINLTAIIKFNWNWGVMRYLAIFCTLFFPSISHGFVYVYQKISAELPRYWERLMCTIS